MSLQHTHTHTHVPAWVPCSGRLRKVAVAHCHTLSGNVLQCIGLPHHDAASSQKQSPKNKGGITCRSQKDAQP
eukprot:449877-Amphidinium_carterae.1